MTVAFQHRQSAHCESGVAANLLGYLGLEVSEALTFGIGAGLFFAYLPFIRVNYLPLVTYRSKPGEILRKATGRLGVRVTSRRFRSRTEARAALDESLDQGRPVGLQTGVFWLPYFPPALRFHFNAHNLVVYGREGESYRISDPVLDTPVLCPADDLERARFAEGPLAPRGRIYSLQPGERPLDLAGAVRAGLRETARAMVKTPVPLLGVRGIRYLAGQLERWPQKLGTERAGRYLGQVIRMQEEIGTGGGGFRFVYAAFLQEAAAILELPRLFDLSREMTTTGDRWREFALLAARRCKGRGDLADLEPLAFVLRDCAAREEAIFRELLTLV